MIDSIVVLGAGGHGKVVADCALSCGLVVAGFIDDGASPGLQVLDIPVLGPLSELPRLRAAAGAVVVAIGDSATRVGLIDQCRSIGLRTPALIHPSVLGFSAKRATWSPAPRSTIPNRETGGTVVTVAVRPWRW